MEPQEFRYRKRGRDACFAVLGGALVAGLIRASGGPHLPEAVPWLGGAWAAGLAAALCWRTRWRSSVRIDASGVAWFGSAGAPAVVMRWSDVDEVRRVDAFGIRLRGGAGVIRIGDDWVSGTGVRGLILRRVVPWLRLRMERELAEGGALRFDTPGPRWAGHLAYLAMVLVASAFTAAFVAGAWQAWATGRADLAVAAAVPFLLGGLVYWKSRRELCWAAGWVALSPRGLQAHWLDGEALIAWPELREVRWNGEGGLDLVCLRGRRVRIPRSLRNLFALYELLCARLPGGGRA
jgi:hypothetical protein